SGAAGSLYYGGTGSTGGAAAAAEVRPSTPDDEEATVKASLAKLSTADRLLAEGQKLCPVRKTRLGAMGPPVKVILNERPVFLCCKGCVEDARADPDRTLAAAERLKAKAAAPR